MSRRYTSTSSIFWGLALVAIGSLLLARNLGYSIPVWGAIARYWPVLIIAWGLLKFVDYYRVRQSGESRPLFSGGEVALLLVVIFAGAAITAAANINPGWGPLFNFDNNFDLWDITGNNFQYNEHHELAIASGSSLDVFNLFGAVDVQPSDSDSIVLDVQKTVRAADQAEADRLEKDFMFSISGGGDHYHIGSSRDPASGVGPLVTVNIGNARQRYKSNLTIRVPRKTSVSVNDRYGRVSLESLEGSQKIVNRYGAVTAKAITGTLDVETGYGAVDIEGVSGALNVTNGYASTSIRNVGGRLEAQSKYGSIDVQDAKGGGSVENRYSSITLHRLVGDWKITGGNDSVDASDSEGSFDIETSYRNISVEHIKGRLLLKNHHGGVDVDLDTPPKANIDISGDYTDVSLRLPSSADFTIDGTTRSGEIDSEFESLNISRSGREQTIHGVHGQGGPHIAIDTRNGRIQLDRKG